MKLRIGYPDREVGVIVCQGWLSPYQKMRAKIFRDRLEFLKHAVEEGDRDKAREYVGLVGRAYERMHCVYMESYRSGGRLRSTCSLDHYRMGLVVTTRI